jgi:aspartyl aminopeptidase
MRGVDIVDVGAAVISMHSPLELSHKGDLYWSIKGFRAFLESAE